MKNETWEQLTKYYKDKFGYDPQIVDVIADYNIIKLCASGSSNDTISEFLDIPLEYGVYAPISNAIERHLGFRGWVTDLGFNPLLLYGKLNNKTLSEYKDLLIRDVGYKSEMPIEQSFQVVEAFLALERMLDEKWI